MQRKLGPGNSDRLQIVGRLRPSVRFPSNAQGPRYGEQADRACRLARTQTQHETKALLLQRVAQDYDDIAKDLESGAVEIRHSEILPQRNR